MWYEKSDTLAAYSTTALTTPMPSLAKASVYSIAQRCKAYLSTVKMKQPDNEAVAFYMMNHAVSHLKSKYLPDEPLMGADALLDTYHNESREIALRLFVYMLLIVTRESRHVKQPNYASYTELFGQEFSDFHDRIRDKSSDTAVKEFTDNPPVMELGFYVFAIHHIFKTGLFSGGYGGKAWADITEALLKFVDGTISAEIFVDTAFTLAHNNGAIFNKGMVYNHYGSYFGALLDVQRAGMLPQLYLERQHYNIFFGGIEDRLQDIMYLIEKYTPEVMTGYVDWYKVESLGALGNYPVFKKKQEELHPESLPFNKETTVWVTDKEYATVVQRKKAA